MVCFARTVLCSTRFLPIRGPSKSGWSGSGAILWPPVSSSRKMAARRRSTCRLELQEGIRHHGADHARVRILRQAARAMDDLGVPQLEGVDPAAVRQARVPGREVLVVAEVELVGRGLDVRRRGDDDERLVAGGELGLEWRRRSRAGEPDDRQRQRPESPAQRSQLPARAPMSAFAIAGKVARMPSGSRTVRCNRPGSRLRST